MANTKIELVTSIPSDINARDRLAKTIQAAVDLRIQIKDKQDELRDLISTEKEDRNFSPKFLKTLIDGEFDKQYSAEKQRRALEDKIEQLEELDILMKRSQPEA